MVLSISIINVILARIIRYIAGIRKDELKMKTNLHTLPIGERIRLVEDIWDSIAADQANLPLTDEQRTELDRRLDAYEADKIKGREAGEVIADIKQRM